MFFNKIQILNLLIFSRRQLEGSGLFNCSKFTTPVRWIADNCRISGGCYCWQRFSELFRVGAINTRLISNHCSRHTCVWRTQTWLVEAASFLLLVLVLTLVLSCHSRSAERVSEARTLRGDARVNVSRYGISEAPLVSATRWRSGQWSGFGIAFRWLRWGVVWSCVQV